MVIACAGSNSFLKVDFIAKKSYAKNIYLLTNTIERYKMYTYTQHFFAKKNLQKIYLRHRSSTEMMIMIHASAQMYKDAGKNINISQEEKQASQHCIMFRVQLATS